MEQNYVGLHSAEDPVSRENCPLVLLSFPKRKAHLTILPTEDADRLKHKIERKTKKTSAHKTYRIFQMFGGGVNHEKLPEFSLL